MEILNKLFHCPKGASILLSYDDLSTCEYYRVKFAKAIHDYPGVVIKRVRTKNHYNIILKKEK